MVKQKIKIMITALSFCFGMCYANGVSEQVDLKSLLRQTVEENTVFPVLLALNAESTADASEATIETIMLKKLIQIEQKLKNVAIKNDDKSTSDSADEIDVKARLCNYFVVSCSFLKSSRNITLPIILPLITICCRPNH